MEFENTQTATSSDERLIATMIYVLAICVPIIGPLVIWLVKKDESRLVDNHGRQYFNCLITYTLLSGLLVAFWIVAVITIVLIPVAWLATIILPFCYLASKIYGGLKAFSGEEVKIPFCLPIL